MSSPLNNGGGFSYDNKGHIQPRRYFDHAGRPLPGNTKNTSYSSIRLPFRLKAWSPRAQGWSSLGGNARHRRRRAARRQQALQSSPLFTSFMKPEYLLARYGRKEPSLRLTLLREKAKEACAHVLVLVLVLELAGLAHQLDKTMRMLREKTQETYIHGLEIAGLAHQIDKAMMMAGTAAEHSHSDFGSGPGSTSRKKSGRDLTGNKQEDKETRKMDVMEWLDECDDRFASDSVIGSTRRRRRYHARAASSPAAQRARDRQERIRRSSRARQPPPPPSAPALPGWLSIARARFDALDELDHQRHHRPKPQEYGEEYKEEDYKEEYQEEYKQEEVDYWAETY